MALQLNYTTLSGLACSNTYARIEQVNLGKTGATVEIRFYKNPPELPPFYSQIFEFSYTLNGPNPIKQAYQFLKTLPEFSDATDC